MKKQKEVEAQIKKLSKEAQLNRIQKKWESIGGVEKAAYLLVAKAALRGEK